MQLLQYKINEFMGGVVDKVLARKQWGSLKTVIEDQGVQVLNLIRAINWLAGCI